jgi:large subunit ribosomal protein L21
LATSIFGQPGTRSSGNPAQYFRVTLDGGSFKGILRRIFRNRRLTPRLVFGCITVPLLGKIMYAVLETGSKQYRVIAGDTLEIERLAVEAGQTFTFDRVLLVNNDGKISVGVPFVSGANVVADVVEHKRGEKKVTFKMKRRKGYHKKIGHRQELTVVKIKEINA